MSTATCTSCGKPYSWRAQRGSRLADWPSPCCHAAGKAVGEHKAPPKRVCPKCGKAGLLLHDDDGKRRDWLIGYDIMTGKYQAGLEPWRFRWCRSCREWVQYVIGGV